MRRVVAVLGAVLLVIVAILVRGVIDGDDDSGGSSSGSDGGSDGAVTLLCADELASACLHLADSGAIADFDTEPAGVTVDRMAVDGAELGADAWLTLDPFPGMADVGRDQVNLGPTFDDPQGTGFSTDLAIVVDPDRADALEAACPDEVDWACLGDLAGDGWGEHGGNDLWGEIRVGLGEVDHATGLLPTAQATGAHLGIDDFATNDLDASDATRWLGRFTTGDDVLGQMVTQGPGAFSAVGALGVEATAYQGTAQGADLAIFYPAPMYRSEVVLVASGHSVDDLVDHDDLADALSSVGWAEDGGSVLPSAGTLYALREDLG